MDENKTRRNMRVIPNGLWSHTPGWFEVESNLIGEEFKGVTQVQWEREHPLNPEEYFQANQARYIGGVDPVTNQESQSVAIPELAEGEFIYDFQARRAGRSERLRNQMSELRRQQLQQGEITALEFLDSISEEN